MLFIESLHSAVSSIKANATRSFLTSLAIIIGTASIMAGYTRLTYALGVIIMETTEDLGVFVPIIFSIIIAN